jgi:hypothetical protein
MRVVETASNAGGTGVPAASAATGVVSAPGGGATKPVNSLAPVVSGTTMVGQVLSASTGTWSGTPPPTFAFQWLLCTPGCAPISGATSSSLKLTAPDVDAKVAVEVTASNSAGSTRAYSAQVGPVTAAAPSTPQITIALSNGLKVTGSAATITQMLKNGGYTGSFTAPSAGTLMISWYFSGVSADIASGHKRVVLASARVVFHAAGRAKLKIALTARGKQLLRTAKHITVLATGTFVASGRGPVSSSRRLHLER